jgi:hypothetical protein
MDDFWYINKCPVTVRFFSAVPHRHLLGVCPGHFLFKTTTLASRPMLAPVPRPLASPHEPWHHLSPALSPLRGGEGESVTRPLRETRSVALSRSESPQIPNPENQKRRARSGAPYEFVKRKPAAGCHSRFLNFSKRPDYWNVAVFSFVLSCALTAMPAVSPSRLVKKINPNFVHVVPSGVFLTVYF